MCKHLIFTVLCGCDNNGNENKNSRSKYVFFFKNVIKANMTLVYVIYEIQKLVIVRLLLDYYNFVFFS